MMLSLFLGITLCILCTVGSGRGDERQQQDGCSTFLRAQNLSGVATVRSSDIPVIGDNFSTPEQRTSESTGEGQLLYKDAFGYFDWQFKVAMPTNARFPIASNTKLFVAVSLYQLQEKGKVNLSRSIADYLTQQDFEAFGVQNVSSYCPLVPGNSTCQVITFVDLLAMTAGIEDIGQQFLPFPYSLGLVVGRYIMRPLLFIPGSQYYYSNPSFMLSAYFIEKFSGLSFERYLKKFILDPLQLNETFYDQSDQQFEIDQLRVSEFHRYLDPTSKEMVSLGKCDEFNLGSANGAGGMISSQDDIARWYLSLFNFSLVKNTSTSEWVPSAATAGAGILSPASLIEIVRPRTLIPNDHAGSNLNGYYTQGLFVYSSNPADPIPEVIAYEGMIQCSWTANWLDLTDLKSQNGNATRPPKLWLGQVWSNTPVFFATKEQVVHARNSQYGNFWTLTSGWPQPMGLGSMAATLIQYLRY